MVIEARMQIYQCEVFIIWNYILNHLRAMFISLGNYFIFIHDIFNTIIEYIFINPDASTNSLRQLCFIYIYIYIYIYI